MKLLKTMIFLFILLIGVYLSYPAFLAFDRQDWRTTFLYLGISLVLICVGLVSLLLTLNPKKAKNAIRYAVEPIVSEPYTDQTKESIDAIELPIGTAPSPFDAKMETDPSEPLLDVATPGETRAVPEPKEDPTFLFEDWWVDGLGLYTDTRLIGITGRKQQKTLRKLLVNSVLTYHVSPKNGNIEILHEKTVLGIIPEFYRRSILTYIQGIEKITAESMIRKGRAVVQFTIRIRFGDELREKLQKKLQQNDWRHSSEHSN